MTDEATLRRRKPEVAPPPMTSPGTGATTNHVAKTPRTKVGDYKVESSLVERKLCQTASLDDEEKAHA